MIVDPKRQKMFENCRARKRALDRNRKRVRAVMFTPPAIIIIWALLDYALQLLTGTMLMLAGFSQSGGFAAGPLTFLLTVAVTGYVAGETMLETPWMIKYSNLFYPAAGAVTLISFIALGMERTLLGFLLPAFCFIDIPLNLIFKRLYDENETLKPLKGYPHFDIMLMSERDLADDAEKPKLDEMTPDERLMYEREHWI